MKSRALPLLVLLFCSVLSAFDDNSELRKASDAHQMFLLRDVLARHPGASDFYTGEVACAFNETTKCEEKLGKALAVSSRKVAAQIHLMLTVVAMREGRYGRALQEIDAALAIDPNDEDSKNSRPLIEALGRFPDQTVQAAGNGKAKVQMEDGRIPILINGKKASYFFDTGANLSVMSEAEATQFGMEIREIQSGSGSTDINGNKVSFRVAVARSLVLDGISLSNVAFLIAGNDQQPFVDMKPGQRGLIGLPVLWAFGSIRWTREGGFEADRTPASENLSAANLCFDDLSLVTQAGFERHTLTFVLDTGASTSDLWPKFAKVARTLIRKSGTRGSYTIRGMGGVKKFETTSIPKVALELGGETVVLQPAQILKTPQRPASQWFYGNLGSDLLRQANSVTIDFRKMTLELSPAAAHN